VQDLRGTVQKINVAVDRLGQDALSQGNMENLKVSLQHLSEATGALAQSSQKLEGVIGQADGAMSSIKKDADTLQLVLNDARKAVDSASDVFRQATHGDGLLPTLLTNKQLAADLRALIGNLRAHGVLFYRDSAGPTEANPRGQPPKRTGR
jgi:hypothetical protein